MLLTDINFLTMLVFDKIKDLQTFISKIKKASKIGFVPTMGALHKGHLSLIKQAKSENDIVVVSIFVNPTQFNKQEDLINYPKPFKNDIKLLEKNKCDILFMPSTKTIYGNNPVSEKFDFDGLEHQMEGKFRDGHFDGVGTIVKKLFEIVTPTNAYFGEKDFQQLQIIKKLVEKNQIPVKITGCKIFREKDGLAYSSRNTRLTPTQREAAPFIYKTLKTAKKKFGTKSVTSIIKWVEKRFSNHPIFKLEYFTIADETTLKEVTQLEPNCKYRAFIAVFAEEIRLIDNIKL